MGTPPLLPGCHNRLDGWSRCHRGRQRQLCPSPAWRQLRCFGIPSFPMWSTQQPRIYCITDKQMIMQGMPLFEGFHRLSGATLRTCSSSVPTCQCALPGFRLAALTGANPLPCQWWESSGGWWQCCFKNSKCQPNLAQPQLIA